MRSVLTPRAPAHVQRSAKVTGIAARTQARGERGRDEVKRRKGRRSGAKKTEWLSMGGIHQTHTQNINTLPCLPRSSQRIRALFRWYAGAAPCGLRFGVRSTSTSLNGGTYVCTAYSRRRRCGVANSVQKNAPVKKHVHPVKRPSNLRSIPTKNQATDYHTGRPLTPCQHIAIRTASRMYSVAKNSVQRSI